MSMMERPNEVDAGFDAGEAAEHAERTLRGAEETSEADKTWTHLIKWAQLTSHERAALVAYLGLFGETARTMEEIAAQDGVRTRVVKSMLMEAAKALEPFQEVIPAEQRRLLGLDSPSDDGVETVAAEPLAAEEEDGEPPGQGLAVARSARSGSRAHEYASTPVVSIRLADMEGDPVRRAEIIRALRDEVAGLLQVVSGFRTLNTTELSFVETVPGTMERIKDSNGRDTQQTLLFLRDMLTVIIEAQSL